jgi:hypothetical protein
VWYQAFIKPKAFAKVPRAAMRRMPSGLLLRISRVSPP